MKRYKNKIEFKNKKEAEKVFESGFIDVYCSYSGDNNITFDSEDFAAEMIQKIRSYWNEIINYDIQSEIDSCVLYPQQLE